MSGADDRERLERALEEVFTAHPHSRRRFVGRAGGLAFMASGLSAALAACGVEGTNKSSGGGGGSSPSGQTSHKKVPIGNWTFSNWPLYIDKKVLKTFDKRYGGHVKYLEDINDNDEFYGKVRQQLQDGKPIGRDIVTLTDYMAARWVRNGYVTKIDKANTPNFVQNLASNLRTIPYDPGRDYTAPWQSGATGIGYNIKKTGRELKNVKDLFDPKFKGRVTMLSEPYDSACTVLLGDGVDATHAKIDQILGAIEKIKKANDAGQFRRFTGNDYTTDLAKGNVDVALAYSGDLIQLQSDNPDLRFSYFEEGNMLFTDNMMMPSHVQHPYAAETMINFVYEPDIAAKIALYVNYIPPVDGIDELVRKQDPKLAKNPLVFPPPAVRSKLHAYPSLSDADERKMKEAMAQVTGA
jgi:spermidine/putrescine transport system substrate-binding protein